ncbi:FHA domain-containing protein [Candidatus Uabimicrobium amorphum]|uniref:FHA domain-containing protein n=1 Tax=Uabimicrobium amorphum TaxID=2596890 RepID=A0A5S9IT89_UABAM|nr:FHA domain-containing protein [Candidatus Uabimicrobium amorphum]BBM86215.1 hypothetical protein UABAM_04601 [Candidatus Uabimicrobium amorphum]
MQEAFHLYRRRFEKQTQYHPPKFYYEEQIPSLCQRLSSQEFTELCNTLRELSQLSLAYLPPHSNRRKLEEQFIQALQGQVTEYQHRNEIYGVVVHPQNKQAHIVQVLTATEASENYQFDFSLSDYELPQSYESKLLQIAKTLSLPPAKYRIAILPESTTNTNEREISGNSLDIAIAIALWECWQRSILRTPIIATGIIDGEKLLEVDYFSEKLSCVREKQLYFIAPKAQKQNTASSYTKWCDHFNDVKQLLGTNPFIAQPVDYSQLQKSPFIEDQALINKLYDVSIYTEQCNSPEVQVPAKVDLHLVANYIAAHLSYNYNIIIDARDGELHFTSPSRHLCEYVSQCEEVLWIIVDHDGNYTKELPFATRHITVRYAQMNETPPFALWRCNATLAGYNEKCLTALNQEFLTQDMAFACSDIDNRVQTPQDFFTTPRSILFLYAQNATLFPQMQAIYHQFLTSRNVIPLWLDMNLLPEAAQSLSQIISYFLSCTREESKDICNRQLVIFAQVATINSQQHKQKILQLLAQAKQQANITIIANFYQTQASYGDFKELCAQFAHARPLAEHHSYTRVQVSQQLENVDSKNIYALAQMYCGVYRKIYLPTQQDIRIGRKGYHNDIAIDSQFISRQHATICLSEDGKQINLRNFSAHGSHFHKSKIAKGETQDFTLQQQNTLQMGSERVEIICARSQPSLTTIDNLPQTQQNTVSLSICSNPQQMDTVIQWLQTHAPQIFCAVINRVLYHTHIHGNARDPQAKINLRVHRDDSKITVTVSHNGAAYDYATAIDFYWQNEKLCAPATNDDYIPFLLRNAAHIEFDSSGHHITIVHEHHDFAAMTRNSDQFPKTKEIAATCEVIPIESARWFLRRLGHNFGVVGYNEEDFYQVYIMYLLLHNLHESWYEKVRHYFAVEEQGKFVEQLRLIYTQTQVQ